ncbi:MAG: isoprenylcysteine carboxylmethyltransferase family protein [Lysobacteraceae bacterium]|nr:MAG: isoprenylcysteine carboxylmethyltransferase family protein [Xanthomonadaceae bacterium]
MPAFDPPAATSLILLAAAWVLFEMWLGWRRRSQDRSRDRGTLVLLLATIGACIVAAVWLAWQPAGRIEDPGLRRLLSWSGQSLMLAGMLLRYWSVRVLARFFTIDVAVQEGHELIRRGPYRWVRHPSYTGSLTTFLGFGLALGNLWSLLVLMTPVVIAFLRRIRVEERVLAEAFPAEYPEYARQTRRLVPFLW